MPPVRCYRFGIIWDRLAETAISLHATVVASDVHWNYGRASGGAADSGGSP